MRVPLPADTALATKDPNSAHYAVASSEKPNRPNPELFTTTRWSLVLAAGNGKSAESEDALTWLCEHYWFPLYAYARQRGKRPDESEDLVQGFFVRVLERKIFSELTAERGRFRAFLLACFHHFMATEWAKAHSQKRGGGVAPVPLDEAAAEERYQRDFTETDTPERDFDRAWALTLLDRVFSRLAAECEAEGKGGRFAVIQPFLQSEREGRNYEDAAGELGVTPTALRVMVFRMRQRFRDMLIDEIRQTVANPGDVAAELRHLFVALGE